MSLPTITALKRRRGDIKARITRCTNYLSSASSAPDSDSIQVKVEALTEHFKNIYAIHEELVQLEPEQHETLSNELHALEDDYQAVLILSKKLIRKASMEASTIISNHCRTESPTVTTIAPRIKLPEISLPRFDGSFEKWHSFRDQFMARIGENDSIPTVDKLQYLQASLTGKAARAIESIENTAANYKEAWDILIAKYDNSRKAILQHWQVLHSIPKLQRDSPDAIDELIDKIRQHIRAMKGLGEPVESWNSNLIFLILSKINNSTRFQWETTLPDSKMPPYTALIDFLEKRGNCSDNTPTEAIHKDYKKPVQHNLSRAKTFMTNTGRTGNLNNKPIKYPCPICKEQHRIYQCQRFLARTVDERHHAVEQAMLCPNCLGKGHSLKECRGSTCREFDDILPTAVLKIFDKDNQPTSCRAILDTASTTNFITDELASKLQLSKTTCTLPIEVISELSTESTHSVTTKIQSRLNSWEKTANFLTLPCINNSIPDQPIDRHLIDIPKNIVLADPEFQKPAPIHLLLGARTTLSLLSVGQIQRSSIHQDLIFQKTLLGWVLAGQSKLQTNEAKTICNLLNIQPDINRFWELEDCNNAKHLSSEESNCESHFRNHTHRNQEGRYVIALPFNENINRLGESRTTAMKRLDYLTRRFNKNPLFKQQYSDIIKEYIELGHMIKLNNDPGDGFYLPHHAVTKEDSLTTKIRVVFDGSALSTSGISLNDTLMVGPTIQDDLFTILLRFRTFKYVLTADIEKMYRQFIVRPADQKYQKILWRELDNSISTYQLTRVTFGLSSSPYLAIRCLHQLAEDQGSSHPIASAIITNDLYVDDLLTGANTIPELIHRRDEIISLLKTGGLNLRQCASNSTKVLAGLPNSAINLKIQDNVNHNPTLKTLGIHWNSTQDAIIYTVNNIATDIKPTKRSIFSIISRIFDPLGLLNPTIVKIKLLIQELWKLKLNWDESLPVDIATEWNSYKSELSVLNDLAFPRRILLDHFTDVQLHGFSDASEKAYGACFYIRTVDRDNRIQVVLYCAKSRVAPIKTIQTIPRLELCAANLLAQLYEALKRAININFSKTIFWTDSMIALHWIRTPPHQLKTFVANRVSYIQKHCDPQNWSHVRSCDNPADCVSRGLSPSALIDSTIWRSGPSWLSGGEHTWPEQQLHQMSDSSEVRKPKCFVTNVTDNSILSRFSSFLKLQRIVALCLRFKTKCRTRWISIEELSRATNTILRLTQHSIFYAEIQQLKEGKPIASKSKLLPLNPFLDDNQILRVGGRLHNSNQSYQQRHPIILPKSHHITKLIIHQYHITQLHGGIHATLYAMRQKYWPIDGRNQIRHIIRSCVRCAKVNPPPVNYQMGTLPQARVSEARPFTNVGIDYCGPFYIKEKRYRNRNRIKSYVAIFICLAVKAVHIEVVSDLTTEAFLAALKRFTSRRGMCSTIYSDNATNFVGANNELKDLQTLLTSTQHNETVQKHLSACNIEWKFIPPQSPHFGGIWEAAVKSFKYHLRRVAGNELFTFEELNTLCTEIEAVLNSRPLTPLSPHPEDLAALTPSHFLIGDILASVPEADFSETPSNRLSSWEHVQKVKRDFWTRWQKEYINELNIRRKWTAGTHPIKEDSIVILRDDNLPPLQWRLGRVTKVYPGKDDIIRTVQVQTASGLFDRSVKKLAPLPVTLN